MLDSVLELAVQGDVFPDLLLDVLWMTDECSVCPLMLKHLLQMLQSRLITLFFYYSLSVIAKHGFLNVMDHPSLLSSISINSTQLRSHQPKEKAEVKATSLILSMFLQSKQSKCIFLK